jgi:hypothetical protein
VPVVIPLVASLQSPCQRAGIDGGDAVYAIEHASLLALLSDVIDGQIKRTP